MARCDVAVNRERILEEALQLVDDEGLDGLSLRNLARRLDVQAPTLYWHVKNKTELLDGLADAIMDDAISATPEPGAKDVREWFLGALCGLRAALLRHRDGARIVSGATRSLRRGDFSERAMATLVQHGFELQQARLLVLTSERYTVGWVLEEQAPAPEGPPPTEAEVRARWPIATQAISDYFSGGGRSRDDLFADGARLIVQSAASRG